MVSIYNALTPAAGKFVPVRGALGLWCIRQGSQLQDLPETLYQLQIHIFFPPVKLLMAFTFQ